MESLGQVNLSEITLFGIEISYNPTMFIMTWVVILVMVVIALLTRKSIQTIPGPLQNAFEVIYDFLKDITYGTLGEEDGRKHLPFVVTLFMFILLSNWIGILPNFFEIFGTIIAFFHSFVSSDVDLVGSSIGSLMLQIGNVPYSFLFEMPAFEEPTKSVNTDLALGLLVFFLVQIYGIKNKGFVGYLRNFFDDPFPMKGWLAFFFFLNPFFYLNLIGVVANVVSHSFRLFGNIFGGSMIIVIVSSLLKHFLVPVGLFAYFGLFAGLVQAFVFTMLTVTYLQQQQ
tara:strand:+ start:7937 stop:8788 length:852 start_codon:yes stop_codon:yes gene_type:complete